MYQQIEQLQVQEGKSKENQMKLQELEKKITFTLSVDYQQSKLTPHWGFTAQPSETYYLRKLSHNILGIVDHTTNQNTVYVSSERDGGSKDGDLTISLVDHYIHTGLGQAFMFMYGQWAYEQKSIHDSMGNGAYSTKAL
jgi:hypothetical protein